MTSTGRAYVSLARPDFDRVLSEISSDDSSRDAARGVRVGDVYISSVRSMGTLGATDAFRPSRVRLAGFAEGWKFRPSTAPFVGRCASLDAEVLGDSAAALYSDRFVSLRCV